MSGKDALLLFNYDWDESAFAAVLPRERTHHAGFDLFSFPSNAQLIGFDLDRFAARLARRHPRIGAVVSHHEQFGALAAALVAEKLGLPGTPPAAVIACQHKIHARRVMQEVAPEANVAFSLLPVEYGQEIPAALPGGLDYPVFVKPVKAAFSVLAKTAHSQAELQAHTRFGWRELWVIKRLVAPFDGVARRLLPGIEPAHRLLLEQPTHLVRPNARQFNLDGWVFGGEARALGVVDSVMYPGTQAFMRFDYPSRLNPQVQARALEVAQRFLRRVGFSHGMFNMEFFYCEQSDVLTVIEFNPRLASQLADLYLRVDGVNAHAMSLALARGEPAESAPRLKPAAGAASSFVFRCFAPGQEPRAPTAAAQAALQHAFPDALLMPMPKTGHSLDRDYTWLGSHRYGVMHLGGKDEHDLRERCERASALLGWPAPYARAGGPKPSAPTPAPMLWEDAVSAAA